MNISEIDDIERLRRINQALMSRVEQSMDQQGNAFSLFQTAINLEGRIRARTEELRSTLRRLEKTNQDLVQAKEAAEIANLSKTRFLAAASHDVLQPLNAARLSISALSDLQTTQDGRTMAQQVERSLETMEELLRTLLDISKLDAGVVRPEITTVQLDTLFQSLQSDFAPLAERKGLRLRFRPTRLAVLSDQGMYRRVVQNIVSNAIRYTRSGGVFVAARARGDQVRVDVIDTGTGIPEDEFDAVFEEFHRGPDLSDDGSGGLGLGLSIVKRMVAALDHPLNFTSVVGKGTVFRLNAPMAARPLVEAASIGTSEPERPRTYGLDGARVLLVENDAAVRRAMSILLQRWGCDVRDGACLAETLAHIEDGGFEPDIIIADQHLDHGDLGTEVITETRRLSRKAIPALITTADFSEDLAQVARSAHMEVMRKPVKPAQLRALMAHMLA
ncbi:hybrid sensor histidine kinase/response regulator [Zhengella mangrovi]|uniref:histidine kinase n=1 Tax=Zhengella mangrovi TaxID=1982044 RepID=A0A2G1QTR3_9HYPH|nr:hybrid sensor histidine kinase/response regulator [Zhengella mangrovi]PHP68850.1 hybrid sensor histidine kinase/response regulator [Zhengella mangrovi]